MERLVVGAKLVVAAAMVLVIGSCGGDGIASATGERAAPSAGAEPSSTAAAPTPTPVPPTPVPTPVPTPEPVTDEELIEAAQAAFVEERSDEFVGWDFTDAELTDGVVVLTVCAWTGFNAYDVAITVDVDVDAVVSGVVRTNLIGTGAAGGDCLNSELIESALAFIDEHDAYWRSVTSDPTTFDPTVQAPELLGEVHLATITPLVQGWAAQGARWEGLSFEGNLPESAVRPLLWRSFDAPTGPVLEVLACRDMDPRNGLYQGDELIAGGAPDDPAGQNSITQYRLERSDAGWKLVGGGVRVWANCFFDAPWVEGMNNFNGQTNPWKLVDDA